jgi:hypothetical protein
MSHTTATGRTAAVIMAKEPAAGRTKTRLCPPLSPPDAARLYEALLDDTIALVSSLRGVRLAVAVTPASAVGAFRLRVPQDALVLPVDGADIGTCLRHATGRLFALGHALVLASGADSPTVPPAYFERAERLLEQHDVVLGPSRDGGYYLVGLRRPAPGLFRGIAWSTAQVMAHTMARAAALGLSVALLPHWYDIDTAADLERLRAELSVLPPQALTCTRRYFDARRPADGMARETGQTPRAESLDLPHKEHRR